MAIAGDSPNEAVDELDRVRGLLREQRRSVRRRTVDAASRHRIDPTTAMARLDAVRWLHRVAYHAWRIFLHLGAASAKPAGPSEPPAGAEDADTRPGIHDEEAELD